PVGGSSFGAVTIKCSVPTRRCRITATVGPARRARWNTEGNIAMVLKVLFEPSDEGGYTAFVPALPGCISEGDTLEEARQNIREAIELYLEPAQEPESP